MPSFCVDGKDEFSMLGCSSAILGFQRAALTRLVTNFRHRAALAQEQL